jgi:ribonuclease HI
MTKIEDFNNYRTKMNELILNKKNRGINRFFALDTRVYEEKGVLEPKIKELLGLVASMVLRCNDCITYHILECYKHGVTEEEFLEAFNVALIVGGSIVIPHLRVAMEIMEECFTEGIED